jgi:hypothetical protein
MFIKKRRIKIALAFFLASQFFNLSLFFGPKQLGADLSTVSDTLSDNRLSFVGALDSGNYVGNSTIIIDTSPSSTYGWAMTDKNFNLFPGDTMMVGTRTNYEVDDIIDDATDNKIQLTLGLLSGDADAGDPVIATRSAIHTVSLTTVSAIANGAFRVRVKAGDANGIPDADGFDFSEDSWNPGGGDVTCSPGSGTYNFGMKTATASGQPGCTAGYHCFECRYNGAGGIGNVITFTIGSTAKLINPQKSAESESKAVGVADTYPVIIEHMNSDNTVADTTTVKVAVVEAVRVTATVEPTLEFTIAAGDSDSDTICGISRTAGSIDTTAATVPLGTLSISSFVNAYQILTVSTNAIHGYAVTVQEDDQVSIGGDGSTTIADTLGDNGTITHTAKGDWDDPADADGKGFGYSVQNDDAKYVDFSYNQTGANCNSEATTFCAKHLAASSDVEDAQSIFYSDTVADSENINFCYRIVIGATQAAGDYENRVTFIATATF